MATETIVAHSEPPQIAGLGRGLTKRQWVQLGGGMLFVLAVVAGGFGTRAWLDRRAEIDRTVTSASETRHELARAEAAVAAATDQLTAAREALETERATLAERERDRDAVEGMLHESERQLADYRATLAAATADLATRRSQLDALNDCVLGVTQALNQISVNDTNGLAGTLRRIEGTCARAGAAL